MQFSKNVIGILSAALLLSACNNVDFKKTKAGVPYKIYSAGKGDSIKVDNIVKFEVIRKVGDSVLFSSYEQGQPQYLQVQPVPAQVTYGDIGGNIMEIFAHAKNGDSIYIVESADSLMKQNPQMAQQSPLKKGSEVITTIKINEVYKTPAEATAAVTKDRIANADKMDNLGLERFKKDTAVQAQIAREDKVIEDYLAKNNIKADKTPWGVYVQVLQPGQGPKPKAGQYATVIYKGQTLEGVVFDSGTYPLQVGMGGSIKGFEEGVKQLSEGGKARVFIPSVLGYGQQGNGPKIGPNQILVFDLELKDISDTPPAAPSNIDSSSNQRQ
jgi:FKBP-type peptidyl-prolyl cis-trans isomerase